jgi:hypothetical protein
MADNLFANVPSFFESFTSSAAQDLMSMQLGTNQPQISQGVITVSDPIVPDRRVMDRLGHMDPNIYDLRDTSHLVKLLKVLLGASGAGGLRKQMAVARLQNGFNGMHFLDLDRFYGALFGIQRTKAELQPNFSFDPYSDAASSEEWDDLHSRDASYRERLVKFAKTIPWGASIMGIKSMAQALCNIDVDVYEAWDWLDEQNSGLMNSSTLTYSWNFLQTNIGTFSAMEKRTWGDWGGATKLFIGRTGQSTRSDFVLHPKRPLSIDEQYELVRVMNVFKPAGSQFTVDNSGLSISVPINIRNVAASSEYWEITPNIVINPNLSYNPYQTSTSYGSTQQEVPPVLPQQRPPFSQYQGEEWSYNNDITAAKSYALNGETVISSTDDELVVYSDGTSHSYQAADASMTPGQALSARVVDDGVMTAMPYAPTRSSINTATVVTPA